MQDGELRHSMIIIIIVIEGIEEKKMGEGVREGMKERRERERERLRLKQVFFPVKLRGSRKITIEKEWGDIEGRWGDHHLAPITN